MKFLRVIWLTASAFGLIACQQASESANDKSNSGARVTPIDQRQLNKLANSLVVNYQALSNVETDCPKKNGQAVSHCFSAEIYLTSPTDMLVNNWQINYSQVYPVYAASGQQLSLKHLNGDIHQITPTANFSGFKANEPQKVTLWIASTVISESELMPNYWLSSKNLTPAVIKSTQTKIDPETGLELQPWVASFDNLPKQIKSSPDDINQYAGPAWLFDHNIDTQLSDAHLAQAVIPTPQHSQLLSSEAISLAQGINVSYQGVAAEHVSAALERLATLGVKQSAEGIVFNIALDSKLAMPESYQLTAKGNHILIEAADSAGAFYGVQTLTALLSVETLTIPSVKIVDQPNYRYRGQHLDVARNFHSKAMVFRLIEQMAAYKLNKLHMHLAEDEGWRIELPSLPELTEIGSRRCMDLSDQQCLQPQLGGAGASGRDGFYSTQDYIDILRYASRHHIQVIPSLDMPGHSRAAIKAMEARYQRLIKQENEVAANRYLLSDFNDKTQYRSIQNYNDNTINVCLESSYAFVDRVLEDLINLHQQAQHPLQMYHIGADETAGAWVDSPACQALVNDSSNSVSEFKHLGAHFIERVAHMVVNKGIAVGGWNDGLGETHVENMPKAVYSYIWGALPSGAHQMVSEQAHRGWDVVLSVPDVFYFDFPYEVDPKERGYNWASRRIDSRNVFNFIPDNLPIHAEFRLDTLGRHFEIDDRLQQDEQGVILHQPLPKNFRVAGIQGQLWSETVRSDQQAEYMIFPRMLALAERAWSSPSWQVPYNYQGAKYSHISGVFTEELQRQRDQQWQRFANTLAQKELIKLDKAGVFYRIPTVGAKIIDGKLNINSSLPGLPLEYQTSNGQWHSYQDTVKVNLPVQVRARSADNKRAGRSLTLH
ncbi:beta-N-acetylhexosaminidase [Thalassotalea insulae]|uniref:beta-N-acetylhexosaminidase n=1 Tax=Thalassotalea insulae TaxID=2056778 RepID=A0ABQ6GVY2_9GAMM|nr:family 20 glycosylhydrolase [Thalassotalea insulae]GLX78797.1 beta-N-acetylhexosaminidase [Thalassotalea insulae]